MIVQSNCQACGRTAKKLRHKTIEQQGGGIRVVAVCERCAARMDMASYRALRSEFETMQREARVLGGVA